MGKNTLLNRKKKLAKKKKKIISNLNVETLTVDQLLTQAQENIDAFKFEEAQVLCHEVLKRVPDHVPALEISGNLCIEIKNFEGAKQCYGRAIFLQPDEGHHKYLSMAQLMDGDESVQCYKKTIELMYIELSKLSSNSTGLIHVFSHV